MPISHITGPQHGAALAVKRGFDLATAAVGLTILAPLLLTLSALSWLTMGRPVFFRQARSGRFGQPFTLIKFRSMADARDAQGRLLPDSARITRFGAFLRTTSLDELPELWNVLTGRLSFVGPRPLLTAYLPRFSRGQARRLNALPGITGWAQVHGRNALVWEEKFRLDVWYVDHWTLGRDVLILARTVGTVAQREGIMAGPEETMPEFLGAEGQRSPRGRSTAPTGGAI